jgi:hypothetical protein
MDGRFAEAEALANEAVAIGQAIDSAVAFSYYGGLMLWAWRQQGRVNELRDLSSAILGVAGAMPAASSAMVAFVSAESGDRDRAASQIDSLDFLSIPRDYAWFSAMAMLVIVCSRLRDSTKAAELYELLAPMPDGTPNSPFQ